MSAPDGSEINETQEAAGAAQEPGEELDDNGDEESPWALASLSVPLESVDEIPALGACR
jgi:hypothetical protein